MMMTHEQRNLLRSYGTLLGRALIGLLFLFTGILMARTGTTQIATVINSFGIPAALFFTWLLIAIKILGGAALIIGYRVGYAAAALIGFTLLTIVFMHRDFMNDINFFKNFALIGGLLYVMAYGAGEGWSLGKLHARPQV